MGIIEDSTPYVMNRPARLKSPGLHVISWNVNGLSALLRAKPNALQDLIEAEQPDIIMLQETKLQEQDIDRIVSLCVPQGWGSKWACSTTTLGYAGVGALWRPNSVIAASAGMGLPEADKEGRCITLELPRFYVVGCYVPNSGDGLKRLDFRIKKWEPMIARHLAKLQGAKSTLYCGDLNVCHQELDLWGNHIANSKGAGYTPEERKAFSELLERNHYVDSFRSKHPKERAFSYWSYRFNCREKNQGWRLDYVLVPQKLAPRVHDAYILANRMGSDHCPVGIVII